MMNDHASPRRKRYGNCWRGFKVSVNCFQIDKCTFTETYFLLERFGGVCESGKSQHMIIYLAPSLSHSLFPPWDCAFKRE